MNVKRVFITILCSSIFFLLNVAFIHAQTGELYNNQPFFDDFNGDEIDNTVWQVATWSEHGGQTGTERCYALDGYLNMIFINNGNDDFLSAAIQTRNEFLYGKWEARIKPSDIPGVLNSFYTIDWNNTSDNSADNNGTKQEIDIEFLTYTFHDTTGEVHFAVHASGKTSFNLNPDIKLDFNPSADFHVWGFYIHPEYIQWFVDDVVLHTYTYEENNISITAPYQIKLNVWSAENWINGPPTQGVECLYLIDWIKFTPYNANTGGLINTRENPVKNICINSNYPNPFSDITRISYSVTEPTDVTFTLYSGSGKKLFSQNEGYQLSGEYEIVINQPGLSPGFYYYTLGTTKYCVTKKCLVIK